MADWRAVLRDRVYAWLDTYPVHSRTSENEVINRMMKKFDLNRSDAEMYLDNWTSALLGTR